MMGEKGAHPTDGGASQGDDPWLAPLELDPATVPAVVVAGDDGTVRAAVDTQAGGAMATGVVAAGRQQGGLGRWLALGVGAVVVVAVGFDTADLVDRAFRVSAALGVVTVTGVAVAAGAVIGMLGRELASLKRLRRIEALRAEADRLAGSDAVGGADRFAGALDRLYAGRTEVTPALARLRDLVTDSHDDGEVIRLIDREVMAAIDRVAYRRVVEAARTTGMVTALSPAAMIDVAVVLWRNLALVREIATLYGARPGYGGSLRLMRKMLANLAVAGVTESAHHVAVDALGGSLAAAVSTRIGQGIINGLLTARIGLAAMHICRPVAFSPDTRPSLGAIRRELLSLPRDIL